MADINKLKDKIKSTIYPNGKGAINASNHQALLLDMADGMAETDTKLSTLSKELESKADKSEIPIPDWDAAEDEAGYIKNRTHYKEVVERTFVGIEKGDYILDAEGNPDGWESWVEAGGIEDESAKVSLPVTIAFGLESLNFELTFDHVGQREVLENEEYENSYASILEVGIDEKEGECYLHFTTRGCGTPWLYDGEEIDVRIESFKRLNDGYIPSTIVRKSDLEKVLAEMESQNEMIEDLQNTKIDKEVDDYYPQLSVGLADNLAGKDVVDSEISFRRSGGGAISDGVARIEAIKGNSVVWNQLVEFSDFSQLSSKWDVQGCDISIANNELVIVARTNTNVLYQQKFFANHSYRIVLEVKSASANPRCRIGLFNGGSFIANEYYQVSNEQFTIIEFLATPSKDCSAIYIRPDSDVSIAQGETAYIRNFRINDVTKAFPVDTPTTIEEFNARKPLGIDENAYNEGEVIHMDAQSLESVGVNQWDEEWELGRYNPSSGQPTAEVGIRNKNKIRIIGGQNYYCIYQGNAFALFYDSQDNLIQKVSANNNYLSIGNREFVAPINAVSMIFYVIDITTYNHDICINLSDASINGKYYPYIKRTQSLAIIGEGLKSAGTAHDEIRYNKATQKWEKVQRIGEVDMGSLTWVYYDNSGYLRGWTNGIPRAKGGNTTLAVIANSICHKYPCIGRNELIYSGVDNSHALENDNEFSESLVMYVRDSSYTNAASFKAAMQGVMLYYELAEPIVTEIEGDFNLDYEVWNCGTEEILSDVPTTPLKADIAYGFNAVGKIKELEEKINSGGGGGVSKEYVDTKVTELSAEVGKKQDTITDLETIRSGASKGATALQEVPETYATKTDVSNAIQTAITNELNADF